MFCRSRFIWPYCTKIVVCVVDKPSGKTKKTEEWMTVEVVNMKFILWSFFGALAIEEM